MRNHSALVVELPEFVDAKRTRRLIRDMKAALRVDHVNLTLDLSRVEEMDSAGADMLLQCMLEVTKRDGTLALAGISPVAATILELTGLDRVFDILPDAPPVVAEQPAEVFEPAAMNVLPGEAVQSPAVA